jgi:pyruvate/2-oxoglutarate/acetoin dehydrogenase E1 component
MNDNQRYNEKLVDAMQWLNEQPGTLFIGQAVRYAGTGMYNSLVGCDDAKKIEFPVVENLQMGYCTGLALNGFFPIAVYPRWNFLLCAADQLVNHLDKLNSMSAGKIKPKMIIRVAKGTEIPVDPQDQHKGNFTEAFRSMFKYINVYDLTHPNDIVPAYKHAYNNGGVTILVELPDYGK